jgi:hypothetical protein
VGQFALATTYQAIWETELAVEVGRWTLALICGTGSTTA